MKDYSLVQRFRHARAAASAVSRLSGGLAAYAKEIANAVGADAREAERDLRFQVAWLDSGCQVIEVGSRLAAMYAATSISEEVLSDFRWPWNALVVQCDGAELGFDQVEVHAAGDAFSMNVDVVDKDVSATWIGPQERLLSVEFGQSDTDRIFEVAAKVALGCCFALTEPASLGAARRRATGRHRRVLAEKFTPITRYVLGNNVRLDLTNHIREYVEIGGASPKVRTLVCGHYKNLVHGPGSSLRKRIWIEPYPQGPESAPLVIRAHTQK